jgi:hypothetical protein
MTENQEGQTTKLEALTSELAALKAFARTEALGVEKDAEWGKLYLNLIAIELAEESQRVRQAEMEDKIQQQLADLNLGAQDDGADRDDPEFFTIE